MVRPHTLVATLVAAGVSLFAAQSDAYCRSTTCSGDCPRDEDNCKTEGFPLYWPGLCVGFSIQREGTVNRAMEEVQPAIQLSFVEWSERECAEGGTSTLLFTELQMAACRRAEYNEGAPNVNVILFQDTKWEYTGPDNNVAKTTVTFDKDTGEILDADIEVNHAFNFFTVGDDVVEYDLQSVMTHEVGHFLGLDHTQDFDATMNASYTPGTTDLRTIEQDDIDGLCAIYPVTRSGLTCNPEPNGGFGSQCAAATADPEEEGCSSAPGLPPPPASAAAIGALASLFALARRRSRRTR